jgi:hypothetical protein
VQLTYRPPVRTLLVIVLAAACEKSVRSDPSCPALSVTVDGAPQPALPYGLAYSFKLNGEPSWVVDMSNFVTDCGRYMGIDGRVLRPGEQTVSANIGVARIVGFDNMSWAHDKAEIVGTTPAKPGDKLTVCITEASITPHGPLDPYKDKTIVINGKLEGTYCGEQTRGLH